MSIAPHSSHPRVGVRGIRQRNIRHRGVSDPLRVIPTLEFVGIGREILGVEEYMCGANVALRLTQWT